MSFSGKRKEKEKEKKEKIYILQNQNVLVSSFIHLIYWYIKFEDQFQKELGYQELCRFQLFDQSLLSE